MAERETLIDNYRIHYEGLFSVIDLYTLIDEYFEEKGYDKREKKNIERVTKSGKFIEIELEPWKKTTDYAQSSIRVRLQMKEVKEVEIEKDGVKVKLNKGDVSITMSAFLTTDYEHKWESKPMFFFLRTIFEKFVFGSYTAQYKAEIMNDFNLLTSQIKSFLNLYKTSY